jgi:tRNA(Ile)-lysidine synthase
MFLKHALGIRSYCKLRTDNWQLATGNRQLLYHFSVRELTERLLKTIRKQQSIRAGDRLAAAVSGGADSVALLCLLLELRAELGIVLSVAHVNHKLRGEESDEDERFVANLARQHGLELHVLAAPVDGQPRSDKGSGKSSGKGSAKCPGLVSEIGSGVVSGVEAAARELRYSFFRQLARDGRVTKIATAHTLDDQAETVLLRIFRGAGIRGLAGIHPRIVFEEHGRAFGELLRPLLGFRRAALQEYLRQHDQSWREDSSNRDIAFLRNRVRHRLVPIIGQEFGESAIEHIAELAEIARAEEDHWQRGHPEVVEPLLSAAQELPVAVEQLEDNGGFVSGYRFSDTANSSKSDAPLGVAVPLEMRSAASLPITPLLALPLAAQRRLVRAWIEANAPEVSASFRLIEEILEMARASLDKRSAGKKLELPRGRTSLRRTLRLCGRHDRQEIVFEVESSTGRAQAANYEYTLAVPGAVEVPELGACIEARVVDAAGVPEGERGQLLNLALMPKQVLVRNWRAGDRYWPAHTASPKKVKELITGRHATGAEKKLWPVAVAEGCGLVWMRGFAVPTAFRAPAGAAQAIWIRQMPGMM